MYVCWTKNHTLRKFHNVNKWYQFLTAREKLVPIRHIFHTMSLNTYEVKFYIANMRIPHIKNYPPPSSKKNLLHSAFESCSSQSCHWHQFFISVMMWNQFFTCVRIWYQFFTCVNFETNFRRWWFDTNFSCEDLVPILHTGEDLVTILHICENLVPILPFWEKS